MGLQCDPYISTSLVNMYVKCGSLCNAVQVFNVTTQWGCLVQDITLWNSVLDGYFRYGVVDDGVVHFRRMGLMGVGLDAYTLTILVRSCWSNVVVGRQIHGYIVGNVFSGDPYLDSALVHMYVKCGRPMEAWKVFDQLEDKSNIVVWNVLINGFVKMDVDMGREVHCDAIKMGFEWDPYVRTSLLTMYGKCRLVKDSERVFDGLPHKEVALWNAMISAYINNNHVHEALSIYSQMRVDGFKSDSFTTSIILSASSIVGSHDFGRCIHVEVIKRPILSNTMIQSSLLTLYAKCGQTEDANLVFSSIEKKDVVAWGSMISAFCQNSKYEDAFSLLRKMMAEEVKADSTIMSSVIGAIGGLEYVKMAYGFHGLAIKNGTESDVFVGSALIDTYGKCGLPEDARCVFSHMQEKSLIAWNSMISCYSRNGLPELSISVFPQILEHGLIPNSVTLTNTLVAISSLTVLLKGKSVHGKKVRLEIQSDIQVENAAINMYIKCGCLNLQSFWLGEEGLMIYQSMRKHYEIEPMMEHCVNMVDLLGRAGRLSEALKFIQSMHIEPDHRVWLCLLCASRTHQNMLLGELAADKLLKMDIARGSNFVQLLNLYGEGELWEKVASLRVS
ncbi:hypothetical protein GIB67_023779 [Kingdonia uniflora]|uniref:Pentatricopeptide repeat-containing protein n=1 Tax=Kingdonia uniflora TaxID=39325 RepID=A0A7J7N438_9MAGN|nr:hypothetical protein GIB67_023779 [Kingdonia uniflora]